MPEVVTVVSLELVTPTTTNVTRDVDKRIATVTSTFSFASYTATLNRGVDGLLTGVSFAVT